MKQLVLAVRLVLVRLSDETVGSREVVARIWGLRSWSGVEEASVARDRQERMAAKVMASVGHQS